MPSRLIVRPPKWYLLSYTEEGKEQRLPLHEAFGAVSGDRDAEGRFTDPKVRLIENAAERLLTEGRTRRPRGGQPKPVIVVPAPAPSPVDAALLARLAAVEARLLAPVPTVPALPADLPPPSKAFEKFLEQMEAEGNTDVKSTLAQDRSNLKRAVEELGDTWGAMSGYGAWVERLKYRNENKPLDPRSKKPYRGVARKFDAWKVDAGEPWNRIPDFAPRTKPKRLTPTAKKKMGIAGQPEDFGTPFTIEEIRKILNGVSAMTDLPPSVRLLFFLGAFQGPQPQDSENFLNGMGTFTWDAPTVWYHAEIGRQKTASMFNVPLAATLVEAIKPYRTPEGGLAVPGILSKTARNGWFSKVLKRLGVPEVEGEKWKRFRYSFENHLEKRLRVDSTTLHLLMGEKVYRAGEIVTAYASPEAAFMEKAIREYEQMILGVPVAASA